MASSRREKSILRKQVEELQRKRLAESDIISITEFRNVEYIVQIPNVLVVEPDEATRLGMKRVLESEGYEVTLAEDGIELSKAMESRAFDLVILETSIPWVDGFELCALIKGNQQVNPVPVILTAEKPSKIDIEKGFASGCDDFVAKPFEVEDLSKVLINKMKRSI